jgi:hypothetical protein
MMFFISPYPVHADVSLVTTGISAIVENDVTQAEKTAFEDAFYKAYLELALKQVPSSASADLAQKLRVFASSRGNQDIVQYHIVSRSQQENVLILGIEIKMNDAPLKGWLQAQTFTTPPGLRPKVLLMVSTRGPGTGEKNEWWSSANKGYSPFEQQLAQKLRSSGENVPEILPRIPGAAAAGSDRIFQVAGAAGADLVLSGSITYKFIDAATLDARLDLSLFDAKTRQKVWSSSMNLKGNVDIRTMNDLLIAAELDNMRSGIAKKVVAVVLRSKEKRLCIEGIKDFATYQALVNSLKSMEMTNKVSVTEIRGHAICHNIEIKGSLQDVMESLKQKQIAPADMEIDNDSAFIKLLDQRY